MMEDQELLAQLPELLLRWYDQSARVLPWREDPTPYRVWVSEIMNGFWRRSPRWRPWPALLRTDC